MAKASPLQASFNGGELSPRMDGRADYEKYQTGCSVLENFIPTIQGPARKRGGTHYADSVLNATYRSWLGRFEFSFDQAFVLEFNNDKLGFFTNRGRLLNLGVPYTITTPYTNANLVNSDGGFALSMVQTGDVVYIAGGSAKPQKLSRLGNTNWTIVDYQPDDGPFLDQNTTESTTIYSSAQTGAVTLTASANVFTADHVGALIRLDVQDLSKVRPWEPAKSITVNDLRRSDGKTYKATNTSTTGSVKPVHSKGTAYDGSDTATGVNWDFQDPGYGIARITAYTSPTQVSATVITKFPFPAGVVLVGNATWRWQFGAWGAHNEYPKKVGLWRDRIVWAGLRTQWMSVSGDYDSMAPDDAGQQTTESAITIEPGSNENNSVRWLHAGDLLLVGTAGCEFAVGPQTDADPVGPANIKAPRKSGFGGRDVVTQSAADAVFFVDKSGRRVREALHNSDTGEYGARDVTVLADHVTESGIIDLAYQPSRDSVLWAARADGALIAFTYEREQNVFAWHRHPIGGDGIVECVACIPAPDGSRDDLWMVVRRTVNGATVRYVEWMDPGHEDGDAQEESFYVDSGLTYSGVATTTLTGLGHLEGETVKVLVNGATHPDRTVSGGSITLQRSTTKAHAGLGYSARLRTMRLEAGGSFGTSQGRVKRSAEVVVRLLNTLGLRYGANFDTMDEVAFRMPADPMDAAPPLFSGDKRLPWPEGYGTDGYLCFESPDPLPCTIQALMPVVVTND